VSGTQGERGKRRRAAGAYGFTAGGRRHAFAAQGGAEKTPGRVPGEEKGKRKTSAAVVTRGGGHPQQVDMTARGEQS
jgi:hypothetical protein